MLDSAKQLATAARAIVERGWSQGSQTKNWDNGIDSFCAVGAMKRAMIDLDERYSVFVDVMIKMSEVLEGDAIVVWNDREGRTKEQVLAKFDELIASFDHTDTAEVFALETAA
jgi:hypothetical protein